MPVRSVKLTQWVSSAVPLLILTLLILSIPKTLPTIIMDFKQVMLKTPYAMALILNV